MYELQENSLGKLLIIKRIKRGKIHSAISLKNHKKKFKKKEENSYLYSQPHEKINISNYEESKNNINNYNNQKYISSRLLENDKKLINQSLCKSNIINEEKVKPLNIINNNGISKNKCVFLTYKENTLNKKKSNNKPINIHKFIHIINSYLLPNDMTFENMKNLINYRIMYKESSKNTDFSKLLNRNEKLTKNNTFELFYKYIIKRTFKETLKKGVIYNRLIEKSDLKNEYNKQLNEIKDFLKLNNDKETKESLYNNSQESFDKINNSSISLKLTNRQYQIITIDKHRKNFKINQKNSTNNKNIHFYDFSQFSKEIKNYNLNSKNKELTKETYNFLLSLPNNNKLIEKIRMNNPYLKIIYNNEKSPFNSNLHNLNKINNSLYQEYLKGNEKNKNINKEDKFQTRLIIYKNKKLSNLKAKDNCNKNYKKYNIIKNNNTKKK